MYWFFQGAGGRKGRGIEGNDCMYICSVKQASKNERRVFERAPVVCTSSYWFKIRKVVSRWLCLLIVGVLAPTPNAMTGHVVWRFGRGRAYCSMLKASDASDISKVLFALFQITRGEVENIKLLGQNECAFHCRLWVLAL